MGRLVSHDSRSDASLICGGEDELGPSHTQVHTPRSNRAGRGRACLCPSNRGDAAGQSSLPRGALHTRGASRPSRQTPVLVLPGTCTRRGRVRNSIGARRGGYLQARRRWEARRGGLLPGGRSWGTIRSQDRGPRQGSGALGHGCHDPVVRDAGDPPHCRRRCRRPGPSLPAPPHARLRRPGPCGHGRDMRGRISCNGRRAGRAHSQRRELRQLLRGLLRRRGIRQGNWEQEPLRRGVHIPLGARQAHLRRLSRPPDRGRGIGR